TPAFFKGELVGFCGSIAHKSDLGGPMPGSCWGKATEIFSEGLHLPPVRFYRRGRPIDEVQAIIGANSRTPESVLGDIRGQLGTARLGERRVGELMEKYGRENVLNCAEELSRIAEQKVRQAVSQWKDGVYEAERFLDDDGIDLGRPIRIHVQTKKEGNRIFFDFAQSADQVKGPANVRPPLVRAACAYCLIALIDPQLPVNEGLLRVIDFKVRDGSLLNPRYPAPLSTYNPAVSAIIDAVFETLSETVPDRKRADGCGSGSITIGGRKPGSDSSYIQYEIICGGGGGRLGKDGDSGISVNHLNSKIAPVEIVESEFPVRLLRYDLIKESGGVGCYRGGLGIVREYLILEDAKLMLRSSKHQIPPSGIDGGKPGRQGIVSVNPGTEKEERLPARCEYSLKKGDVLRIERPGGGGLGDPLDRNPTKVLRDVEDGYLSLENALKDYGVVIRRRERFFEVDTVATESHRSHKKLDAVI
ncbi:MAG: hydantoinase B/oxoprolinase family protein, partial [Deltaproteobacteria bacterium]|nr:hydantoinase B/oxoprolinase family protein [Deltaproteobacteria bacterium]